MMANYSSTPGNSSNDPFSFLASPSSSNPVSRSLTPSNASRAQPSRTAASAAPSSTDAFSSLLGPSFVSSSNAGPMSLAARQAAAKKEQQANAERDRIAKEKESTVWSGLDMFGSTSSNSSTNNAASNATIPVVDDDWLFDKIKPTATSSTKPTNSGPSADLDDDWGLSDFGSQPQRMSKPNNQPSTNESMSLFDALSDGDLLSESFGGSKFHPAAAVSNVDAEDDILGMLGKPVTPKPSTPSHPTRSSPASPRQQNAQSRSSSPPPHLIGQIVEMGFSPQQARLALASTDTGLDVQQALETLLSNGVGADRESESPQSTRPSRGLAEYQDDDDDVWEDQRRENPREQRSVSRQATSSSAPPARTQDQSPALGAADIQERADKLLAQASEIGLTVFSRANAFWKDGKEKVQKVYEERAAKAKPISDGRPKWMQEVASENEERTQRSGGSGGNVVANEFRDEEEAREDASRRQIHPNNSSRAVPERVSQAIAVKTANLFDDEPGVYVSPARRRPTPARSVSHTKAPPTSAPSPLVQKPLTPPTLRTRQTVSASASAITSSNAHKAKGTELYKLGQYANAEQAYSAALTPLPANHLFLIPLYNNRALSRMKIGEHPGAVEDCTTVLSMIGLDYHPSKEAKVTREDEGASVDLGDALLKALRRRAEAYEGHEKWDLALKDWEAIMACEWSVKMRSDASIGASRCRKMITAERDPPPRKTPAPRPASRPAATSVNKDSKSVKKLQTAYQAQEQEEQAKADLKDSVDARLNAWKGGKEANVRALVASLDTVLWPELGWQKVGMHELVTPGQVKVRYMKAIAKLHPDKINAGNTTVEQRMIANGVFATLNDAWIAFKQ